MLNRLSLNRIGLNRIGLNRIGKPSGGSSDRPYIDPKVLNSLCGVWIMDQNTNESESRNIIKNKIADRGGDLELLNFAYKANSGYNSYPEDFTSWDSLGAEVSKGGNKAKSININFKLQYTYSNFNRDVESFKVKISNFTKGILNYYYRQEDGTEKNFRISPKLVSDSNGVIELPKSYNTIEGGTGYKGGFLNIGEIDTNLTIEQLPLYEGALVTDGKDDMIVSQKTVQEMLGGSNEITVVSMIHQIGRVATNTNLFTNCIQYNTGSKGHNIVNYQTSLGKTGIYGYSRANVSVANNEVVINNILGDKADYLTNVSIGALTSNEKFSVVGYLDVSPQQVTSVAVYWTFIANKVLTTDEINQIIGYFKLDKYVTPQVIYDVKRQGLTNDTPAADWYLKDFSGNGHDMQLYNYAKKGNSGVGKYEEDFTSWSKTSSLNLTSSGFTIKSVNDFNNANWILWSYLNTSPKSFKIRVNGSPNNSLLIYRYQKDGSTIAENIVLNKDGVYELPASIYVQNGNGFRIDTMDKSDLEKYIGLSVEQIPDYEGALVSDGKDDYGHADNLPIFKDYTVAIDRAWIGGLGRSQCLATKNLDPNWGAFNLELSEGITNMKTYSFGVSTNLSIDANRKISYQSKYSYNGAIINVSNIVDGKDLFLFRSRSAFPYYAEAAVWSYILFPYTLSEFLLERQLKKYKLGTLYPDMVEWRPVVKSNVGYDKIVFHYQNKDIQNGTYLAIGSEIVIYVRLSSNPSNEIKTLMVNGTPAIFMSHDTNINVYQYKFYLSDKSPQKINITIDEYIRFEDIVQPYPIIVNLSQDGKILTWGDKLKVGSEVVVTNYTILLPELYTHGGGIRYNGTTINLNAPIVVAKSMVFTNVHTWKLNTTEPHAIYSPQKLNIPNSSLKILGYIPDLTGKGNHGKLNNFAYTEDSGVAADGSVKFDGTDDHITIPTLAHGGKCVMMKVNWSKYGTILYDQRVSTSNRLFAISSANTSIAYSVLNEGNTYIDGVFNTSITDIELQGITHNIVATNQKITESSSPIIGSNFTHNQFYAKMAMYEFMLFPEIPSEDEIKKLNDVMGIEGGYVESPNYYWDAYGKKNSDTDRNLIADQVSKDVANALEVKNVAYNSESGYTDDNGLLLDGVDDHAVNTVIPAVTDFTVIAKREFPESALVNNQTFLVKGDAINGNNNVNSLVMECYWSDNYVISFQHQNVIPLEESKISWATPTSYNGNVITKGSGVDSAGLAIGRLRELYRKVVFYKLMFYTKTIDQLSINMLKNLFERDELIDVTNPIFKKQ